MFLKYILNSVHGFDGRESQSMIAPIIHPENK